MAGLREFAIILTANVAGLVKELKEGEEAFDAFGFETRLVLRSIGTAITALGAGITGFVALGVSEFKKFEKELNNFTTLLFDDASTATNEITELTKEYSEAVLDLSVVSGKAAVDLARGLYDVISAGSQSITDSAEAIDVLTVATQLSVAGLSSVETAADGVTTIMNAYATSNVTAAEAADFLANTVIRGKTRLDELNGSMGRLAPLAAQVGISLRDLSIVLAQTTRSGLKTDEAITSIRGVMRSFLKPTDQVRAAAKLLALQLKDSTFAIDVNAIRTKGLVGILGQLADRYRSLEGKEQADFVNQLGEIFPRIRGLSGGIASLTQFLTGFGQELELDIAAAERTGTALKQFEDQTSTLSFATDRLSSAIAALAIESVDGALAPALKGITNAFAFFIEVLRDIPILGDLISLFAAIIGPIVAATGAIILFAAEIAIMNKFIFPLFIAQMTKMGISTTLFTTIVTGTFPALVVFGGLLKALTIGIFGSVAGFAALVVGLFLGVKAVGALSDAFVKSKDILTEEEKTVISISENIGKNIQAIKDLEEAKRSDLITTEEKINLDTRIKGLTEGITQAQLELNAAIEATPLAKSKRQFEELTVVIERLNNLGKTKGDGFFAQIKDAVVGFPDQIFGLLQLFKISGLTLDRTEAIAKLERARAVARKKFNIENAIVIAESAEFKEEELKLETDILRLKAEQLEAQKDQLGASDLRLEALNKEIALAKALTADRKKTELDLVKLEQDRAKEQTKRAEIVRKLNAEIAESNATVLASKAEEFAINVELLQQAAAKTRGLEDDITAQFGVVGAIVAELDARNADLKVLRLAIAAEETLAQEAKLTEAATRARTAAIQSNIDKTEAEIEAIEARKKLEIEGLNTLIARNRELELSRQNRLEQINLDNIRLDIASKITGVESELKAIEIEKAKLVREQLQIQVKLKQAKIDEIVDNDVLKDQLETQRDALQAQADAADKLVGFLTRGAFQRGLDKISDAVKNIKFDFEDLVDLVLDFAGSIQGELTSALEGLLQEAVFGPDARKAIKSEFDATMRDLRSSHAETMTDIAKQRLDDLKDLMTIEAAKRLEIGQTLGLAREELRKELLGDRKARIEGFQDEKEDLADALEEGLADRQEAFDREIIELKRQLAEKEIEREDFNKKVAELERDLAQDIIDINDDAEQDLLDARETFNDDIVALDEAREQELAAQRAEFAGALKTQFEEFVGDRVAIEDSFRGDLLAAQEQFTKDVTQAMIDLQTALEEQGDPIANFFDNLFAGIIGNFTSLLAQIGSGLIIQGFGSLASSLIPGASAAFASAVEGTALGEVLGIGAGAGAAGSAGGGLATGAGFSLFGTASVGPPGIGAPATAGLFGSAGTIGALGVAALSFAIPLIIIELFKSSKTTAQKLEQRVEDGAEIVVGDFFGLFQDSLASQGLDILQFGPGFGPTGPQEVPSFMFGAPGDETQVLPGTPEIANPLDLLLNPTLFAEGISGGGLRGAEEALNRLFDFGDIEGRLQDELGFPIENIAGDVARTLEGLGLKFAGFLGLSGEAARQFAGNFGASFAETVAAAGGGIEELLGAIDVLEKELGVDGATLRNIGRIQTRLAEQLNTEQFTEFRDKIIEQLRLLGVDVDNFAAEDNLDLNFIASALEGTGVSLQQFLDIILGNIDAMGEGFVDLAGLAFEGGQAMQIAVRDGFGDVASITQSLTPELQKNLQDNIGIIQKIAAESGEAALGVVNAIFTKITQIRDDAQAILDEPTSTPDEIDAATQAIKDADIALAELQSQAESGEFDFAAIFGDLGLKGEDLRKFLVGISKDLQTVFTDLTKLSEEELDKLIDKGIITIETKTLELQRRLLEAVIDIDTVIVSSTGDAIDLNNNALNDVEVIATTTYDNIVEAAVVATTGVTEAGDAAVKVFAPGEPLDVNIKETGKTGEEIGDDIIRKFIGVDGVEDAGVQSARNIAQQFEESFRGPGGVLDIISEVQFALDALALSELTLPNPDNFKEFVEKDDKDNPFTGGGGDDDTFTPQKSGGTTTNINLNAPKARVVDKNSFNQFARDIRDEIDRIDNRTRKV